MGWLLRIEPNRSFTDRCDRFTLWVTSPPEMAPVHLRRSNGDTTFMFVYIKANTKSGKKVLGLHPFPKSSQEQETAVSMWKMDSTIVEIGEIMSAQPDRRVLQLKDRKDERSPKHDTTYELNKGVYFSTVLLLLSATRKRSRRAAYSCRALEWVVDVDQTEKKHTGTLTKTTMSWEKKQHQHSNDRTNNRYFNYESLFVH